MTSMMILPHFITAASQNLITMMANNTSTETSSTGTSAERPRLLPYPRFFFVKEGTLPDEEQAKLLWNFRKNRPSANVIDAPQDGKAMLKEMTEMRVRLRKYIAEEVWLGMKEAARSLEVVRPTDRSQVVTEKDLVKVLQSLTDPEENNNERTVFMICHEFHHSRLWLASKVDEWLLQEGMLLLEDTIVTDKTTRASTVCRGGFGAIARNAKSQAVAKRMSTLSKSCGWYLATTDKSKCQKKGLSYVRKIMTVQSKSIPYYLVRVLPKDSRLSVETTVRTDHVLLLVKKLC
jgi:hypothetical protein